ncbi:MAG TPA: AAA family ATPase, partial [Polyangiales bacterium]|nr:AAA family ATPase [Polyangiales bacterium]
MSPVPSAQPSQQGALIGGRYRIEALLDKGGMGAVYAAIDTASGKRIAVKRLASNAPKFVELFKREWRTLYGLRDARIIEVYDYGQDEAGAFYTMELLEGSDLSSAAPMPWREVCACLRDTASILGLLHARRLLHRDLSPKNLWRLPNGNLKLIDFGALAPFGSATDIVGTPPFVPPESVRGSPYEHPLDQRADLFALGALGYWLLTGTHAYPAKSLSELRKCWEHVPAPASSSAKQVHGSEQDPIPHELDTLIASMLRLAPSARPASTDALIDRINGIAGLPPEAHDAAVQGYLRSKAFVGRDLERRRIDELMKRADAGELIAVSIEADPGMGRTRLLEELSVMGRLAGATAVSAAAVGGSRPYGVASRLVLALLDALPEAAMRAAARHALLFAHLSSELRERFPDAQPTPFQAGVEARVRLQDALSEWVLELAQDRLLLVLVDDIQNSDEESVAWLTALALQSRRARLLLVASLRREIALELGPTLRAFRNAATRMRLLSLTGREMRTLLRSVFGDVPYLDLVAQRLHERAAGQPAYTLQLAAHLVDSGVARYADGTWALPTQIADAQLPLSPADAYLASLERISSEARALARVLSVSDERLSRTRCMELSDLDAQATERALVELTLSGVLSEDGRGYRFGHASLRETLSVELTPARRAQAARHLGEALLAEAGTDSTERIRAALYLFRAGELVRARQIVREAATNLMQGDASSLSAACSLVEQAIVLYREAGCSDYDTVVPLTLLGGAGYVVDYRFAKRYGDPALDMLERQMCFGLARGLRGVLGARGAFVVAMIAATIQLVVRGRNPGRLVDGLRALVGVTAALNGIAVSCRDTEATERYRRAMAPLEAFGDDHIAGFMRRSIGAVSRFLSDRHAETMADSQALSHRLQDGTPIAGLLEPLRRELLAGHTLMIGVLESWCDSPGVPELADRLAQFGPVHAMCADRLLVSYHSGRGDMARARHYAARAEAQAVLLGATWQMMTWGPLEAQITALWTRDAMLAKSAARDLVRLAAELPSLVVEARRARATYLLLRSRHGEVISLLEHHVGAKLIMGSTREHGLLARAYNALGQHAKARDTCTQALSQLCEADQRYVLMTLHAQIELARAEAGLGNFATACGQLDALLHTHRDAGPLTRGALHEARALVALAQNDAVAARVHVDHVADCYGAVALPTLTELSDELVA